MGITITKEQAESFAMAIYPDIKDFINEYKKEFEQWKQNKEQNPALNGAA